MKKIGLIVLLTFGFFAQSSAQEEVILKNLEDSLRVGWWVKNSQLAINFAQASFNDSWQGGGVNNIALGFLFNNHSAFTKGKGIWTNDLQFQYGFLRNKGLDLRKSVDRIFAETKYSRKINDKLNWFGAINFLSQFSAGYNFDDQGVRGNMISNLFAPGFLAEGIGMEYKPVSYFALQLGGATLRQTFVSSKAVFNNTANDEDKSYGVSRGKTLLNEMGFQAVAVFDKDIAKNLNLKWRYQAFLAYAPQSKPIDHNINLIATAKVNKYMNVNFSLLGIYDSDQVKKFQLSQGLAAGLSLQL